MMLEIAIVGAEAFGPMLDRKSALASQALVPRFTPVSGSRRSK